MKYLDTHEFSLAMDNKDPLKKYRQYFNFPKRDDGRDALYFCGHSLGLMPKKSKDYINEVLDSWAKHGVEGHFLGDFPWLPYHEFLTAPMAKIVGAKEREVVVMNTLTVNLHLMMVSFYRPTKTKFKILIENNTFPSDQYAVASQARFHGFDPQLAILELVPDTGKITVDENRLLQQIIDNKDELALVMLGDVNYLSGQSFDIEKIVKVCHDNKILVGFNLAHGAGNLNLKLHDWHVDFAVWCSYKYLNSGPGNLSGCFIHETHLTDPNIKRFEGWWGTNKEQRFKMEPKFAAIPSAEAWQLSNPPIFQMAAMRASLEIYDRAGMPAFGEKRDLLTGYLEYLLRKNCSDILEIQTPGSGQRGCMLSLKFKNDPKEMVKKFAELGIVCDFREPNILRMAPNPLYISYADVYELVTIIKGLI